MRPIQVFLPRLGYSIGHGPVSRDARRAFEAWDGSSLMYLLPGLEKAARWSLQRRDRDAVVQAQAIGAEHLDDVQVFHIGAHGNLWDPSDTICRVLPSVDGLLDAWLNLDVTKARWLAAPPIELLYPSVEDGRVVFDGHEIRYEVVTNPMAPGPAFPMTLEPDGTDQVTSVQWPLPGVRLSSVDPDAEAAETFGPREAEERNGVPGAVDADGNWHPHLIFAWPGVFGQLMGPAAGLGPLKTWADMSKIMSVASTDRAGALKAAKAKSTGCVSEGIAPFADAVFMPTGLRCRRDGRVFAFWEGLGINAASIDEALKAPLLKEPTPVTRVWGGEGLLWALLIERLEGSLPVRHCQACGRALEGRKQWCGPDDDPVCYRKRRTASQRRLRRRKEAGVDVIMPARRHR